MTLNEMIIVYEGVCNTYVTIDGKTKLIMDYLSKGTIFRANHFLSSRRHAFNVGVEISLVYFFLKQETLKELGYLYPELRQSVVEFARAEAEKKLQGYELLDYIKYKPQI